MENFLTSICDGPSIFTPIISRFSFKSKIRLSEIGSLSATFPLFNRRYIALLEASYSSEAKRPQPPLINPQPTLGSHQPQHFRKLFRISTKDSPSITTAKHISILIEGTQNRYTYTHRDSWTDPRCFDEIDSA